MVKQLLAFCLVACSCFGQAYTLMDTAFLGKIATPNQAPNITNGLVAYWKMGEGSGTNVLDSWSTNNMVFGTADLVWSTNGFPHATNVYFPTNNAFLSTTQYNTAFNVQSNDFSLTAWFYPTNSNWNYLLSARDFFGPQFFALKVEQFGGVNKLCLDVPAPTVPNGTMVQGPALSDIQLRKWHFVAATRSGTNYTLFLDGTNTFTGSGTNQIVLDPGTYNRPTVYVGFSSFGFLGNVQEVTIRTNYALSPNEVSYLFFTYYGGPPPEFVSSYPNITNNLIVYLKMNEGSGYVLHNSTTNGTDGWTSIPPHWTDKGHNHKYALNFGQGGYGSTADLVGYDFVTNLNWSVGMWICHTSSAGGTETMMYKNTSSGFPTAIPNPQIMRHTGGGGVDNAQYYSRAIDWQPWGFSAFDNKWTFQVITKDISGEHIWYVCNDGVINTRTNTFGEAPDPFPTPPYGHAQYELGNSGSGAWLGYMEEFRIHNGYCLSSNEVWYLYNRYYNP